MNTKKINNLNHLTLFNFYRLNSLFFIINIQCLNSFYFRIENKS